MKRYAIYDSTTGEILRIVRCPESMASKQCEPNQGFIEAPEPVSDTTHRVEGGIIIPIP